MKFTDKYIILAILCFGFGTMNSLKAQNQEKKRRFGETITTVGEYQNKIQEANKIDIKPKITEIKKVEVPLKQYPIIAKQLNTDIELSPVKPLDIRFDKRVQTWNNFLKAGIGNYLNPYVEFFHNGGQREEFTYGVHFKHYSSNMEIKDIPESTFGNNLIQGQLSKSFENHTLNAKVNYRRNGLHYYGVFQQPNLENDVNLDSIRQVYNYAGFDLNFGNYSEDEEAFMYKIFGSYNYAGDHYKNNENNLNFALDLNKKFFLFDFSDGEVIGLLAENENYFYSFKEEKLNASLIRIKPYIRLNYDMFRFYAGLDLSFTSGEANDFFFYPDLKADLEIIPKKLILYAGLNGKLERNSLAKLTKENPFLSPSPVSNWTNNKFSFYGGLKGNIVEAVDYQLNLSYGIYENHLYFTQDTSSYMKSGIKANYADLNKFQLGASLTYHLSDKINARAFFNLNSYSTDGIDKAYQLPTSDLGIEVTAKPVKKLELQLSVANRGKVPYLDYEKPNEDLYLDSWTDLSIGGSYDITETISAFVKGNNLLNKNYETWKYYPVQGINVMVGGSIKF